MTLAPVAKRLAVELRRLRPVVAKIRINNLPRARRRPVAARIRIPNLPRARRTL